MGLYLKRDPQTPVSTHIRENGFQSNLTNVSLENDLIYVKSSEINEGGIGDV